MILRYWVHLHVGYLWQGPENWPKQEGRQSCQVHVQDAPGSCLNRRQIATKSTSNRRQIDAKSDVR